MSILSVAIQNMLAHENRLNGDTTPVKPHIRAWQKQISDRIAFNRFMLGLEIPLTHSAIPTLGTAVPSFTRATTETGQKWDDNGYLDFTALAGEIVFKGARRERNLLTFPEDFSNAAWTKTNTTEAVSSVVIPTAARTSRITNTTANGIHGVTQGPTVVGGGTYQFSVKAVAGTIPRIMLREASETGAASTFDLTTGTVVANESGGTGYISPLVGGGYLCTLKMVATTSGIKSFYIYNMKAGTAGNAQATYVGTTAEYVDISAASLNDITGETDQTTIRPYVSVGVESAPAYHGSMVDGVKCYDTDRLGNPIATTGSYPIVGYVPWEARTNLCLQSQTLDNASWTKNNTTVSANAAVAPDGTTTADLIYPTTTGTFRTVLQTVVTSVAVYAYGVYAKAAGKNFIGVYAPNGASLCWFNLSTGVVGTNNTGLTPLITPAGNGWYRCGLIGTNIAVQQFYFGPHDADASNTATTSGTDGIYVWGAQVELGAFAGPYIPTTTVAVARNADVLTYTGAALAALATQGWCYAEVGTAWSVANVGRIIIGATAATVSPLTMYNLDPTAVGYFDGANATAKTGLTSTATGTRKRASTWGGSTVLVTGDGAAPASGAFDGSFSIVELGIGCNTAGANIFSGGIRNVRLGYNKLSDSELRAITS